MPPSSRRPVEGSLVYSTEAGRLCPACRRAVAQCACGKTPAPPVGDGVARVQRESKGRGGKVVTVVRGVPLDAASLEDLGKQLRQTCGTGGTVKAGVIELQGDHADRAVGWLLGQGFRAKRAGA